MEQLREPWVTRSLNALVQVLSKYFQVREVPAALLQVVLVPASTFFWRSGRLCSFFGRARTFLRVLWQLIIDCFSLSLISEIIRRTAPSRDAYRTKPEKRKPSNLRISIRIFKYINISTFNHRSPRMLNFSNATLERPTKNSPANIEIASRSGGTSLMSTVAIGRKLNRERSPILYPQRPYQNCTVPGRASSRNKSRVIETAVRSGP